MEEKNFLLLQEQTTSVQKQQDIVIQQLENYMEQLGTSDVSKNIFQRLQFGTTKHQNKTNIQYLMNQIQNTMTLVPQYIQKAEKIKEKVEQLQERILTLKQKFL